MPESELRDRTLQIVDNRDLGGGYYRLTAEGGAWIDALVPAQFVMLQLRDDTSVDPMLRRPFSISDQLGPGRGTFLYKAVGRGTDWLAARRPGAELRCLGPLGNGFALSPEAEGEVALVAGGIGIAPFPAVCRALAAGPAQVALLFGVRTASELPVLSEFERYGIEVQVATEDGSRGHAGRVTGLVDRYLAERAGSPAPKVLSCGPEPMLAAVAEVCAAHGTHTQASLEERMGCGFGVCLGCSVEVRHDGPGPRYERICCEGPVFDSRRVVWS